MLRSLSTHIAARQRETDHKVTQAHPLPANQPTRTAANGTFCCCAVTRNSLLQRSQYTHTALRCAPARTAIHTHHTYIHSQYVSVDIEGATSRTLRSRSMHSHSYEFIVPQVALNSATPRTIGSHAARKCEASKRRRARRWLWSNQRTNQPRWSVLETGSAHTTLVHSLQRSQYAITKKKVLRHA